MPTNDAVTFPAKGTAVVEPVPDSDPGPEEIVVETTRTLISSGTELALLTDQAQYTSLPVERPGYSHVGEVVEVGTDVSQELIGTRVGTAGSHRKYVTVPQESAISIPDGVSDEAGTFHSLAAVTMNGLRRGRVVWGERVGIFGLGLIGQLTGRFAHVAGATPTVGLEIADFRRGFFPERPGMASVDTTPTDYSEDVEAETGGHPFDVVIEATGNAAVVPEEFDHLRDEGRFVLLSSPRTIGEFDYYRDCHRPGYEIIGAHARTHASVQTPKTPWTRRAHQELFFALLSAGRVEVESMITHRFQLTEAPSAYDMLLEDRTQALGVILTYD